MAKKDRRSGAKRKPGNRSGNPARTTGQVVSLASHRSAQELDALVPAFVRWYGEHGVSEELGPVLDMLSGFFRGYAEDTGNSSVTSLEPAPVAELVADLHEAAPELALFMCAPLDEFLHFLEDTGRWTGSQDAFEDVQSVINDALAGRSPLAAPPVRGTNPLDAIVVPSLSLAERRDGYEEVAMVRRARALLSWLGEGKEVTGTGVLKLKDINAAAACVDIDATGSRTAGPWPSAGPVVATSMAYVPRLAPYWFALEAAGMLQVNTVRARPTAKASALIAPGSSGSLDAVSDFVSAYVGATLSDGGAHAFNDMVAQFAAVTLIGACSDNPPLASDILATKPFSAGNNSPMEDLLRSLSSARIKEWADDGLVTIGSHVRVPVVLRQAVRDAFAEGAASGEGVPGLGGAPRGSRFPASSAATYQLKVELTGAKPPIWRRVLLPAETPLDAVHETIQLLFGWLDCHLHQFQTAGWNGPKYGPVDEEDDMWGEPPQDESALTLADLLVKEKETLDYVYDFGDNWTHKITLEKILEPAEPGTAPRCTGGRGLAPFEDSGGIWGWMEFVDAVNDPSNERHEECLEWAGLRAGNRLDPQEFDHAAVEASLAVLRLS